MYMPNCSQLMNLITIKEMLKLSHQRDSQYSLQLSFLRKEGENNDNFLD